MLTQPTKGTGDPPSQLMTKMDKLTQPTPKGDIMVRSCGRHGITINPAKFKITEWEIDFVGLRVLASETWPQKSYTEAIQPYPLPRNITKTWKWFGTLPNED